MKPLPRMTRWVSSPQPVLVGALGVAALGMGAAIRALRPSARTGRGDRCAQQIGEALAGQGVGAARGRRVLAVDEVRADVHEGFGKPTLVSADVVCRFLEEDGAGAGALSGGVAGEASRASAAMGADARADVSAQEARRADVESASDERAADECVAYETVSEARDMLSTVVKTMWNMEIAPVAVRGRVLVRESSGATKDDEARVLADMTSLGYAGETARPDDLYERLGPPAADPTWRP